MPDCWVREELTRIVGFHATVPESVLSEYLLVAEAGSCEVVAVPLRLLKAGCALLITPCADTAVRKLLVAPVSDWIVVELALGMLTVRVVAAPILLRSNCAFLVVVVGSARRKLEHVCWVTTVPSVVCVEMPPKALELFHCTCPLLPPSIAPPPPQPVQVPLTVRFWTFRLPKVPAVPLLISRVLVPLRAMPTSTVPCGSVPVVH